MRIIITQEAARGALKIIGIYLACVLLISFLVFLFCDKANAESHTGRMTAVVSFNDAEQLAAISDSIVGVCDTVVMTITRMEEGHSAIADSFRFVLDTVGTTITCRELVCVTVTKHQGKVRYHYSHSNSAVIVKSKPGTAIITWKKIKVLTK